MLKRLFNSCLIRPEDVRPSRDDFEVIGVFNPGVIQVEGGDLVILARVAERPKEVRWGYTAIPRWNSGQVSIEWVEEQMLSSIDPRWVKHERDDIIYLTHSSHLRVFRSKDGRAIDSMDDTVFTPETEFETYGVEDARITRIDGTYYFTYVAVSPHGAATALASTQDFRKFERRGIIFPPENKDVVLFSEKINDEFVALHRPNPATHFSTPEMWLAYSPDLVHWGKHRQLRSGVSTWESGRTGAGAPPLKLDCGWLEIYHGNRTTEKAHIVGAYSAGALLLAHDHPGRVIAQSQGSIFEPEADFETQGFVPNVVFPTAVIDRGDVLQVFYGAADTSIGVVEFSREELLGSLVFHPSATVGASA